MLEGYTITESGERILPDGTTATATEAFKDFTGLKDIVIPDGVAEIGEHAFSGCTALQQVTIPGSVTRVGSSIFYGCTSLRRIIVQGAKEMTIPQWGAYAARKGYALPRQKAAPESEKESPVKGMGLRSGIWHYAGKRGKHKIYQHTEYSCYNGAPYSDSWLKDWFSVSERRHILQCFAFHETREEYAGFGGDFMFGNVRVRYDVTYTYLSASGSNSCFF